MFSNSDIVQYVKHNASDVVFYSTIGLIVIVLYANMPFMQSLVISSAKREQFFTSIATTFQDFLTLTLGIIVGALPFVILGVLISVLIQTFVPASIVVRRLPKNKFARRIIASFLGVLMPVCECGNVPVARSLIMKGFTVEESIVFLLAAPSINIVTFAVTWEAFNFDHSVAVIRVIATLFVANVAALMVAKLVKPDKLLTKEFATMCETSARSPKSLARTTKLFRTETWLILRLLVIGALIAAASQTLIPKEIMDSISSDIFLSVLAMLLLAFIISICSSVDAFFALAYVNTFSMGSIMSFLIAGPMVDVKMIVLMKTTYTYRVLGVITGTVLSLAFIIGVGLSFVW